MPLPIALTVVYLAVNLPFMYWLEWETARGRRPPGRVAALSSALRYGPPLSGAGYLVVISGDWLFVLFVLVFFAVAAWLMTGLLAFTNTSDHAEAARSEGGLRDRDTGAPSARGRNRVRR